jgi:hypothetical protein
MTLIADLMTLSIQGKQLVAIMVIAALFASATATGLQQAFALNVQNAPGSNAPGANTLYAIKINPAVSGAIAHIVVVFPPGFVTSNARVFHIQNIGAGHLSIPNSTSISYDVTSPATITSGTQVALLLGNINNTSTVGLNQQVKFATTDSSNMLLESNPSGTLSIVGGANGHTGAKGTTGAAGAAGAKGTTGATGAEAPNVAKDKN